MSDPDKSNIIAQYPVAVIAGGMVIFLALMFLAAQVLWFNGLSGGPTTLSECVASAKDRDTYCRASGRAGDTAASGDCAMQLSAGRGRFFATSRPKVVSEHYDYRAGPTVAQSIRAERTQGHITAFQARIACRKPAGQSCSARARISAKAYPLSCAPHRAALRIY